MAKKKKDNPLDYINIPSLDINPEVKKNVWALFILALAIVSALGLLDQGGALGLYLKQSLTWLLGWGRWLLPIAFFIWTIFIFFKEKLEIKFLHYLGLILLCLAVVSLLQLSVPRLDWPATLLLGKGGGNLGYWLATGLVMAIGLIAAFIISFFIGLISLMFIFNVTLFHLFYKSCAPFRVAIIPFKKIFSFAGRKDKEDEDKDDETDDEQHDDEAVDDEADQEAEDHDEEENEDDEAEDEVDENDEESDDDNDKKEDIKFEHRSLPAAKPIIDEAVNIWFPTKTIINLPIELLETRLGKPKSGDVKECGRLIQSTLANFGIQVEMDEVSIGPTVTQYSLRPADGVKLSKITNLQNNLSMALAAHPLRIEAPIPGKPLVGIEVPNKSIATVGLREIITSEQFKSKGSKLTFALGKDVTNKAWVTTIDSMPHLMVAGQTMSGKSVMINSIIISLLYHNNPDDLRMIMVDTKRIELTQYNEIPHLLTPVITDAPKTINALRWTINEMDRRLRLLEKYKKKDIASFNQTAKQKLPYIVFIIDELADLMMLSGKEVEPPIVRIAQLARAVGIHLILATQRPSVDVITGLIKANLPARIAFAVASSIDSRTILDGPGAEKLLGRGDMLFTNASMPKPKRIQGAFVSEKEIQKIVAEIKKQAGRPKYLDGVTEKQKVSGNFSIGMGSGSNNDGDEDDKLEEAREIIINSGKASATMLQRHLSVGYARAAKLLDILQDQGVIGPSQGAKPREVLITKDQYQSGVTMTAMPLHRQSESKAPKEYLDEVNNEEADENDDDENEADDENNDDENNDDENNDDENNDDENNDDELNLDEESEEEELAEASSDEENDDADQADETSDEGDFDEASSHESEDEPETKNKEHDENDDNDNKTSFIKTSGDNGVIKTKKPQVINKPETKRTNSFVELDYESDDEKAEALPVKRVGNNPADDFDRYFAR